MEIPSYLLAFSRLARVQCAWWGHRVDGSTVDRLLAGLGHGAEMMPRSTPEQLVGFSHVNTAPFHPQHGVPVNRTDLVPIRAASIVLGRLFKVHALFDDILLDLLASDPSGSVLLVGEPQEPLTIKTYQRIQRRGLQRNLKTDRINFIDYWAYMGALATARVVLDTHPYGGCLTALDALSNGVPLVVLPGPAERGRHAASIYQQMGVSDFVAANASDYVRIAARQGTDDNTRGRERIRASYLGPRHSRRGRRGGGDQAFLRPRGGSMIKLAASASTRRSACRWHAEKTSRSG